MSQYQQPPQSAGGTASQPTQSGQQGASQKLSQQGETQQQSAVPGANQQSVLQGLEFPTSSHLPEQVRTQVIRGLNQTLADMTVILTQARFAHWNVKGMSFHGLHELFEDIYEELEGHVDALAERITALGGQALGTAGIAVQNCRIPEMPTALVTGQEFVQVLAERLAVLDANLQQAIMTADELNDLDTADLLNEISRDVSKALWFLDAHLQTQPISAGGSQETSQQGTGQQPMPAQQR